VPKVKGKDKLSSIFSFNAQYSKPYCSVIVFLLEMAAHSILKCEKTLRKEKDLVGESDTLAALRGRWAAALIFSIIQ
jgi:hypothetical protein